MKAFVGIGAAIALFGLGVIPVQAQEMENYFRGPMTIVIPYGPGGLTDARGRAFQEHMEDVIGQTIIVQNVAGGGALVGTNYVYARPSDGQTVLVASTSDGPHAHAQLSPAKPAWDWSDWTPIGQFGMSILGFVSSKQAEWSDMEALLEKVRAEPGSVTLASIGPGRMDDLYMLEFMQATDTLGKWNWVFYTSSATIQADLLSGDIDVGYLGVSRQDMIDHPNFNVLAMGIAPDEIPDENFPFEWPTVEEVVGRDLDLIGAGYSTVFVKADTPKDRLAYLEQAFRDVVTDKDFQQARMEFGEPATWTPREEAQTRIDAISAKIPDFLSLREEWVQE
ncbi:Bug family tripartite tricarboxylate transporter substrate binding protein [Marinivivus vitaminiproducens]|uniref:Bug family tripartite tricarboxylate transporter substrate binding protein n=1 Tax=Marinivivus vitaminiproducens TaxID=3035935 RepID=UPI00279C82F9|nr:tripartite tricarboxylate transporter substrate binding protein [Geminicoccaceae bacterium SCSIO 64248]